jgi:hypothetical protein
MSSETGPNIARWALGGIYTAALTGSLIYGTPQTRDPMDAVVEHFSPDRDAGSVYRELEHVLIWGTLGAAIGAAYMNKKKN